VISRFDSDFPQGCPVTLTARSVLGEAGRIAARLDRYEFRPEQLEMAEAVEHAIVNREHLIVEAGTGVGKSFAYLVPAILGHPRRKIRRASGLGSSFPRIRSVFRNSSSRRTSPS
jgi:hypothetical protein